MKTIQQAVDSMSSLLAILVIERIEKNIECNFFCILSIVTSAFHGILLFERTGYVEGREDDGPPITNSDAF